MLTAVINEYTPLLNGPVTLK